MAMGNAHDPKVGDLLLQSFMPQAFPEGHIHPVGGGPFIEGGGQRSAAILRAAEGQVKIRAGPLQTQRPGAVELQSADLGVLPLPLLMVDHFPASWPLLQHAGARLSVLSALRSVLQDALRVGVHGCHQPETAGAAGAQTGP